MTIFPTLILLSSLATVAALTTSTSTTTNDDGLTAIFTQTNSNDTIVGNEVVMYLHNKSDDTLRLQGRFPTGGLGSNFQLASQGGMIVHNNNTLFSVNSQSNTISVFRINGIAGLTRTHLQPSLGLYPNSIAAHGNLVYVLNSFGLGTISGFTFNEDDGTLTYKSDSLRILNAFGRPLQANNDDANQSPSQIGFTPDGKQLIVLIKGSLTDPTFLGSIRVYDIDENGFASAEPTITFMPPLSLPFSFNIIQRTSTLNQNKVSNILLLTNANEMSVSSLLIHDDGSLSLIGNQGTIGNGNVFGICWNVNNGKFMYASAAPSNVLQSFRILTDGSMELLNEQADTFDGPALPLDNALAGNYLYTLQVGFGTVNAYFIDPENGSIRLVATGSGLEPSRVRLEDGSFEQRNVFAVGLAAQNL